MGSLPGGGDSGVAAATDGGRRTAQQSKSYEVPVPPETYRLADLGVHQKRFASTPGGLYCRTPAWPQRDFESGVGGDFQAQILTLPLPSACPQAVVRETEKA
ncbi:hypothetical protein SCMC78_65150 [Streptomyces sp. CMC78]|uniref:Uncharacterized protein n=1 Tax=Streptomyces sp. CMC78 TaxID=3231512 RepID=A0AB33KSW2_9ACTN